MESWRFRDFSFFLFCKGTTINIKSKRWHTPQKHACVCVCVCVCSSSLLTQVDVDNGWITTGGWMERCQRCVCVCVYFYSFTTFLFLIICYVT
ncbi:hypothetical protein DM02DRAFT_283930 [Periconia macrospinosa]|uniref:Uncharacterized protein n=1 Tax=Periconia macrospinosa TaxID=97972 RepID=A0A2V1EDZ3_9PLEO|nr:hypothetical protein DM02DRAFT_283930 [Periconia macrospinosa]